MRLLERERATLDAFLPGLDARLSKVSLLDLEQPGNDGIEAFREVGGPGLLIPPEHGGAGANALEAIRVQRAIGVRSPSLAVATTMHHFSLATLVELSRHGSGLEWMLLEAVARGRRIVASGFAEGRTDVGILSPTMRAEERDGVFVISGNKKPCSLSRSMDLLTASVAIPSGSGEGDDLAVALIPADSAGIERRPFWNTWVLAGAESDEVVLTDVEADPDLVIRTHSGQAGELDDLQASGFLWFELLITASYLGTASALGERALHAGRGDPSQRCAPFAELEGAMAALEGVARAMVAGEAHPDLLAQALLARYAAQGAVARAVRSSVELLGGMAFIASPEIAYLAAASHALAFHPPSRSHMADALCAVLEGRPLRMASATGAS